MKLVAHTPVGVFETVETEFNAEDKQNLLDLLVADLKYLKLDTPDGVIVLKSEILKNSLFKLVD
jgi:hypothetical protein